MKLPLPRSLQGQTVAVLLLGLLISDVIGILLYSWDRGEAVASTQMFDVSDRMAAVASAVSKLPAEWRADIAAAASSRTLSISLAAAPATGPGEGMIAARFARTLKRKLPRIPGERIIVALQALPGETPVERYAFRLFPSALADAMAQSAALHASVRLDDGQWLNFVGIVPTARILWPGAVAAYILSVAIVILGVALWLVRRVSAPLTAFARAAEDLGRNIRSDPLPEKGSREVVQASRAFNEMQERLRRLVENRTQMLAAISHDLRTPLTLVRLRAELGGGAGGNGESIIRALDELDQMIASILDFTKGTFEDEPQRSVDLSALIGSVCDDLADTGGAVEFHHAGRLPYPCRRIALRRAFTNLIENAIKYGGSAQVRLALAEKAVDVTIEDHGPGIPEDQLGQVFSPFFRGDGSRSRAAVGAGLGLSIAQAIIHGHGGTIALGNRPEGGLRVEVSLPR